MQFEGAAFAGLGLGFGAAAVFEGEGADDVKAEALAAAVGAAGEAALEDVGQVLGRDAAARVCHAYDRAAALAPQRESDAPARRREGERVVAEILRGSSSAKRWPPSSMSGRLLS